MVVLLKPYEIARNNRQTTYQSELHTTVQSNSIYLLSYNDLFVFALMHLLRVAGDQHYTTQQTHNRRTDFTNIFIFVFIFQLQSCSVSILFILHHTERYFCVLIYKNKYARVAVYIEIRSTILQCNVTCTKTLLLCVTNQHFYSEGNVHSTQ